MDSPQSKAQIYLLPPRLATLMVLREYLCSPNDPYRLSSVKMHSFSSWATYTCFTYYSPSQTNTIACFTV